MLTINHNAYRSIAGFDSRIRFLVLHYTAGNFAAATRALTGSARLSAHYLVPTPADPTYLAAGFDQMYIFGLVDERERAWHAGVSHWRGFANMNENSIGIEIVNEARDVNGTFSFPAYDPQQVTAVVQLAQNILMRYPRIQPKDVIGHADIAYLRKSDPGPEFPWRQLHDAGVGAWYQETDKVAFEQRFNSNGLPPANEVETALVRYGYARPDGQQGMKALLRAFQMHFRPGNHEGVLDTETCAILYALNKRYS